MRNVCLRILTLALGVIAFVGASNHLHGQQYTDLIRFTNTWRYNQSGANLGSATAGGGWGTAAYNDQQVGWLGGPALLAFEPDNPLPGNYGQATLFPNTVPTPLSLTSGGGTNGTNITFYFRTKFMNTLSSLNGVELWATNLVDDGCVIYLNGVRVADVRLANANPSYLTLADGGPTLEGQYDARSIPVARLIQGENTMAVEVHQSGVNSSDIAFAMRLVAVGNTPLSITTQPQSVVASVGKTAVFSIGVSGGPVSYRWFRTGQSTVLSTSNTLSLANVQLNQSGTTYYCIVSNLVTPAITSQTATLTVIPDAAGPTVLGASVLDQTPTNIIRIDFDETLSSTDPLNRDTNSYRVFVSGTTNQVLLSTLPQVSQNVIILRVATNSPPWFVNSNYYIVINNVSDLNGFRCDPNTVIPLSWNVRTNLAQTADEWLRYQADFDPTFPAIYNNTDWTSTNYVPPVYNPETGQGYWFPGNGIFARVTGDPSRILCAGDDLGTRFDFLTPPVLFLRKLVLPSNIPTNATLALRYIIDDGMVLYLNGREIMRTNLPAGGLTINTFATASVPDASCWLMNVPVSNLLPGTNWLAAAIYQANDNDSDTVFGLEIDGTVLRTSPAPTTQTNPLPRLTVTDLTPPVRTNLHTYRISWPMPVTWPTGYYGYTLEYTTNFVGPLGKESVWFQAPGQSNPYTNTTTGARRFFRLNYTK